MYSSLFVMALMGKICDLHRPLSFYVTSKIVYVDSLLLKSLLDSVDNLYDFFYIFTLPQKSTSSDGFEAS